MNPLLLSGIIKLYMHCQIWSFYGLQEQGRREMVLHYNIIENFVQNMYYIEFLCERLLY